MGENKIFLEKKICQNNGHKWNTFELKNFYLKKNVIIPFIDFKTFFFKFY